MKRVLMLFLMFPLLFLITENGHADCFEAIVTEVNPVIFSAEAEGIVKSVSVLPGTWVYSGEEILAYCDTPVFSERDGKVALLNASDGDEISGTVLEIEPREKYTVYFTLDGAYKSPENQCVKSGEKLYLKCTADGSHKAIGLVTSSDAEGYTVETLGGELFVGETVYAFRDELMPDRSRVGKGTVVATDRVSVSSDGWIRKLAVQEGDPVWRGQLLYTWTGMESPELTATEDMLISEILVSPGERVTEDQALLKAVKPEMIRVSFSADETQIGKMEIGDKVVITYAMENHDIEHRGSIVEILEASSMDYGEDTIAWDIRVLPEDPLLFLGATAEVRTGE